VVEVAGVAVMVVVEAAGRELAETMLSRGWVVVVVRLGLTAGLSSRAAHA